MLGRVWKNYAEMNEPSMEFVCECAAPTSRSQQQEKQRESSSLCLLCKVEFLGGRSLCESYSLRIPSQVIERQKILAGICF